MLDIAVETGESRVVERPRVDCPSNHMYLVRFSHEEVNLRPHEAIRGKRSIVGWEGRRE
jgi:hypothetical protein